MTEVELPEVDRPAVLALVWRDLWRERICNEDEFDSYRYEFGFIPKAITECFSELDWCVVEAFVVHRDKKEALAVLAREVNDFSSLRGEAMLHFWVRTGRNPQNLLAFHHGGRAWKRRMPPVEEWMEPYMAQRWDAIEDLIFVLEGSGLYMKSEEISNIAEQAESDYFFNKDNPFGSEQAWEEMLHAAEVSAQKAVA
jgi:hypothetical protein